jgi:hypothetical protein
MWRLWALALGEKSSTDNNEADKVTLIRTSIVAIYILANIMIMVNIVHHW